MRSQIPMRARLSFLLCLVLLTVSLSGTAHAAEPAAGPSLDRLAQVGRLWGTVRYLHPYLLYRDIDWDAALVAALPRVEAAKSPEEYAAAVQGMLAALGDPVTRVLPAEADTDAVSPLKPLEGQAPVALTRHLDDGTLVLDLTAAVRSMGSRDLMMSIGPAFAEIVQQRAVIVDLRGPAGEGVGGEILSYVVGEIGSSLVSRPCRAPSRRFVQRSGYQAQEGTTSGGYYEGFVTTSAESFAPPSDLPAVEKRVVFLVSRTGTLPAVALALQAAGDARIVSEGPLGEDSVVTTKTVFLGDGLGEGLNVRMRVSEMVPMAGWRGLHADVEMPEMPEVSDGKPGGDAALAAARAELKKDGWGKPAASASSASAAALPFLPEAVFRPDQTYPEMLAPDLPHRRLAVIRAWNVIHFFYPYLPLIGDWDAVLPEFLGKMEKAETGKDYALTIDEMMAHVPDGHTSLYGRHPGTIEYYGAARLPLAVRWIEEAAVITAVSGDEAKAAGLLPGDAIAAVDGEPVAARIERLSRYVSASTRAAQIDRICGLYLLRGPAGPAVLSIQGLDGKTREVRLTREKNSRVTLPPAGDTVRILPGGIGNVGYVDLTRLTVPEVDALFEKVKDTRALILDMRGYPQGTAWSIAPRLNTNHAKIGAQFRRSLLSALSDEEDEAGIYFSQPLPPLPPGKALYTHPTVMLIDDRAISQSEHSGLFYEAANGTKFIGTPSAGADGDVTSFTLPGGIHVNFAGHDVRHADGRQLQRVGLLPDVVIAPTRAGIREGKDEVLERAVRFLDEAGGGG